MDGELTYLRLSPPSENGKDLVVDEDGRLRYHRRGFGDISEYDDAWALLTPDVRAPNMAKRHGPGYHIISAKHKMALDYDQCIGEQIQAKPYHTFDGNHHTVWHISPDSEIYTIDAEGEKKYLWPILDGVYVTHDEHLAERWTAVSLEGFEIDLATKPSSDPLKAIAWITLWVVLFLLAVLLVRRYA